MNLKSHTAHTYTHIYIYTGLTGDVAEKKRHVRICVYVYTSHMSFFFRNISG